MRLTDLLSGLLSNSMAKAAMPDLFGFGGAAPAGPASKGPRKSFEERKAHLRAEVRVDKRGRRSTRWVSTEQAPPPKQAMPSLFDLAQHLAGQTRKPNSKKPKLDMGPGLFDQPAAHAQPASDTGKKDDGGAMPGLFLHLPEPPKAAPKEPPAPKRPDRVRNPKDMRQEWAAMSSQVEKPAPESKKEDSAPEQDRIVSRTFTTRAELAEVRKEMKAQIKKMLGLTDGDKARFESDFLTMEVKTTEGHWLRYTSNVSDMVELTRQFQQGYATNYTAFRLTTKNPVIKKRPGSQAAAPAPKEEEAPPAPEPEAQRPPAPTPSTSTPPAHPYAQPVAVTGKGNAATIKHNAGMSGLEISFDAKPERSLIDTLKSYGFRWSARQKVWYARDGQRAQAGAAALKAAMGEGQTPNVQDARQQAPTTTLSPEHLELAKKAAKFKSTMRQGFDARAWLSKRGLEGSDLDAAEAWANSPENQPEDAGNPQSFHDVLLGKGFSPDEAKKIHNGLAQGDRKYDTNVRLANHLIDHYHQGFTRLEQHKQGGVTGNYLVNPQTDERIRLNEHSFAFAQVLTQHPELVDEYAQRGKLKWQKAVPETAQAPQAANQTPPERIILGTRIGGTARPVTVDADGSLRFKTRENGHEFVMQHTGDGTYSRDNDGQHVVYKQEGKNLFHATTMPIHADYSPNDDGTYNVNGADCRALESGVLQVGATKVINGVTYRLNNNHRWERVDDQDAAPQASAAPASTMPKPTRLISGLLGQVSDLTTNPDGTLSMQSGSMNLTLTPGDVDGVYHLDRNGRRMTYKQDGDTLKYVGAEDAPAAEPPAPAPAEQPAPAPAMPSGAINLTGNMPAPGTVRRISEDEAKDYGNRLKAKLPFKIRIGYDKQRRTLTVRHATPQQRWSEPEFNQLCQALDELSLVTSLGKVTPGHRMLYKGEISTLKPYTPAEQPAAPASNFVDAVRDHLKDNTSIRNVVRINDPENARSEVEAQVKQAMTELALSRGELTAFDQHGTPSGIRAIAEQVHADHVAQAATEELTPDHARVTLEAAISKVEGEPDPAPADVAELRSAVKNMQLANDDVDGDTSHVPTSPQDTPPPAGQKYLVGLPPKVTDGQRRRWNEAAEKLIADVRENARVLTVEERQTCARYSGDGGIGGSLNEYYTPPELGEAMWNTLRALGSGTGHGLEPSCGPGVMAQFAGDDAHMDMVELSPLSAGIANALFGHRHDVHSMSFEGFRSRNPDARYDFQIGNPPFCPRDDNMFLDSEYQDISEASRYFTLATLDHLKEGGISMMVLPAGIARNKNDAELRARILARAEVVAIHGLPTDTFKRAGTETATTDVWILRGRPEEVRGILDSAGVEGLKAAGIHDADFISGKWHEAHPEQMHATVTTRSGQAGAQIYARDGQLTPEVLEAIQNTTPLTPPQQVPTQEELLDKLKDNPKAIAGWLKKSRGKEGDTRMSEAGHLQICINGRWHNVSEEISEAHRAAGHLGELIALHSTILNHGKHEEANQLRGNLERLLREYLGKHGNPHDNEELRRISKGTSTLNNLLAAIGKDGTIADKYLNDAEQRDDLDSVNDDDPQSVLSYLRRTGQPATLNNIRRIMGHSFPEETAERLIADGFAYHPERDTWMNAAEFYVGDSNDVKALIERGQGRDNPGWKNKALKRQAEELERRVPVVPLSDFEVTPRDTFVPLDVLASYLSDAYVRDLGYKGMGIYGDDILKWLSAGSDGIRSVNADQYGNRKQIANFVKRYVTGAGARKDEAEKYAELDEGFKDWLAGREADRSKVEEAYSARGAWLEPTWSTDPVDKLIPGWRSQEEGGMTLHHYQNEAIHRSLAQGGGIIALDVGLGKTVTAIAQMLYAKSSGVAQKPCAAVPKSVIGQWRQDALRVKPDAKVLVIGAEQVFNPDGTPKLDERGEEVWNEVTGAARLDEQLSKAKAGDYDMVLVTHTTLGRIQFDPVQQLSMIEEEFFEQKADKYGKPTGMSGSVYQQYAALKAQSMLDSGELTLDDLDSAAGKLAEIERELKEKYAAKQVNNSESKKKRKAEKEKERQRLKFLYTASRALSKDDAHPLKTMWGELGFDHLVVDEAHEFKGLWTYSKSRSNPVKYLGAPTESSQRAVDLYYKTRAMRDMNGGRGVYLLTATPIKNSPVELYNMLSFTAPQVFKRLGINNLDQFMQRYCKIESVSTVNPDTGELEQYDALVGLKNLNELRREAGRYINRKTAEQVGLKLPFNDREVVHVEPREEQAEAIKWTVQHPAEAAVKYLGAEAPVIYPTDDEATKLKKEKELEKFAQRYALAIPHITRRAELDMEMLDPVQHKGYVSPKVQHLLDELKDKTGKGEKAVVFCDVVNMPGVGVGEGKPNPHGYSFHDKLKHLIHGQTGVPLDKIAIVNAQTCPDSEDRLEVSNGVKSGKYQIVIGNTGTMGQGINLQHGVANLLNLDVPWNPAVDQQRQGRVVRQGNTSATVNNKTFLGTRGLDKDMYDVLQGKGVWYNDFWNGESDQMDTESQDDYRMTPERLAALALDDPEERAAALQAITQRDAQNRRVAQRMGAVKQFHKLQTAHKALESAKDALARAGDKATDRQRQAVPATQRSIDALADKLKGNPAFADYAHHIDNPQGVMIDPASGKSYRDGDRVTVQTGSGVSHFVVRQGKKKGEIDIADLDVSGGVASRARTVKLADFALSEQQPYSPRAHLVSHTAEGQGRYYAGGSPTAALAYHDLLKAHPDAIAEGLHQRDSTTPASTLQSEHRLVRRGGKAQLVGAHEVLPDDTYMLPGNDADRNDINALAAEIGTQSDHTRRWSLERALDAHHFDHTTSYSTGRPQLMVKAAAQPAPAEGSLSRLYTELKGER